MHNVVNTCSAPRCSYSLWASEPVSSFCGLRILMHGYPIHVFVCRTLHSPPQLVSPCYFLSAASDSLVRFLCLVRRAKCTMLILCILHRTHPLNTECFHLSDPFSNFNFVSSLAGSLAHAPGNRLHPTHEGLKDAMCAVFAARRILVMGRQPNNQELFQLEIVSCTL